MKKRILKTLVLGIALINMLTIKASANTYESITSTIRATNSVTANSDQWVYCEPYWRLATPGFHQAYANVWALVDNKWYYIDENSNMLCNVTALDSTNGKKYHFNSDGSLLVNSYYNKYYANSNGELIYIGSTY